MVPHGLDNIWVPEVSLVLLDVIEIRMICLWIKESNYAHLYSDIGQELFARNHKSFFIEIKYCLI